VPEPRPVREGREKADAVRFEHGLGRAPIRDLFGFIERNHHEVLVVVRPMADGPDGALLRAGDRWLIVVNSDDRWLVRQRFTAAHELAHYLFDRDSSPVHLDGDLFGGEAPAETRANAFAVHLILPASVIRERMADGTLNPRKPEPVLTLAIEYGLSLQSLSWHLKNVLGLSEAERRRIADIPRPLRLANRLGLTEQIRQERAARDRTSWPQQYLVLAAQAFEHGKLDEGQLAELLEDPELASEIVGAPPE
jgi:Zn-dependent peptidase ImmA (M78 family)